MGDHLGGSPKKKHREVIGMKYLCANWQGFLQMIVYLCSRGYNFYCLTLFPIKKKQKWEAVDKKLIERYRCNLSKFQKARKKKKGVANFAYLRWENHSLIMHTKGIIEVKVEDQFKDVKKIPILIRVSDNIEIKVYNDDGKYTCRLSKDSYRGLKSVLWDIAKTKNLTKIKKEWDKLNGLPTYSGILEQKKLLRKYLVKQARKHQVKLSESDLRLNTRRKIYKVWEN